MSRPNAWPNVIAVTPDSSRELKERVYRLRYQIYVEELKHKLVNNERCFMTSVTTTRLVSVPKHVALILLKSEVL